MSEKTQFESVWDAIEDDPVRRENLKQRSELMATISETVKERDLKQQDAAERLHISQPRVSALLKGKIEEFRLDTLVARTSAGIACVYQRGGIRRRSSNQIAGSPFQVIQPLDLDVCHECL